MALPPTTETGLRIGIDLGGTKIEGVALDSTGTHLFRGRRPTPAGDYAGTVETVAALVEEIEADVGRGGTVGVGIPGTISHASGLVKNANSVCLIGHPFDRDLARRLDRPVRVANDADCFALSEATDGAAAGHATSFGVILGTGVGGGLVAGGRPIQGPNGIAGEWGHNPLPWPTADELPGPQCYCGKRGCIETFLSGPGLSADHALRTGARLSPREIAEAAASGDADADRTMTLWEDRLARGLATVINVFDPGAIVVGGGLGNIGRLYANLPSLLPRYVFSDRVDTLVLPPRHGDSSGVRGAAWLWSPA